MKKIIKKSRLADVPAWVLSLVPLFGSPFLLIALAGTGDLIKSNSNALEIILCCFYPIPIAVVCFFICKLHPKSVWYTPLICSAFSIVPAIFDSKFWILTFWTTEYWTGTPKLWIFHTSIVLSVILGILGARIGKNVIEKTKLHDL